MQHISFANAAISNTLLSHSNSTQKPKASSPSPPLSPRRRRRLLLPPSLSHRLSRLIRFPSRRSRGGSGADMAEVEAATVAAAETSEVAVAAAAAEGAPAAKAPHKLQRQWAFWYDIQSKPKPGAAWGTSLRKGYTFDTVEEFWCLYDQIFRPSKVMVNADFHLFKAGVEPKWEDPECANGGKWTVPCSRKTTLENMWLETLMALIGEQFDESEEICGVVASVRQRGDKLALWTRTASNEAVQVNIGKKWKEIVDYNDKMVYSFHDDAKREKPSRGGRYNV